MRACVRACECVCVCVYVCVCYKSRLFFVVVVVVDVAVFVFICFPQSCIISFCLKSLYFQQKYGLFSERVLTTLRKSVCD